MAGVASATPEQHARIADNNSMGKIMPEVRFLYDDGTEEIVKLSQYAYDQTKEDAAYRGVAMYAVIKEMADELRETKQIFRC